MYLKPGTRGVNKMSLRWSTGIWLGVLDASQEFVIGTTEGCIKVRDVRRYGSPQERWSREEFDKFQGTPWEPVPGRTGAKINVRVQAPPGPSS